MPDRGFHSREMPLTCGNTPVSFVRVPAHPELFQLVWCHDGVSRAGIGHASVAEAPIPAAASSSFTPDLLGPCSDLDPQPLVTGA